MQVVGSIQYTNDLDVHIALITALSYAKERAERFYTTAKTNHQIIREYIDLFGFMSKNPNAMVRWSNVHGVQCLADEKTDEKSTHRIS